VVAGSTTKAVLVLLLLTAFLVVLQVCADWQVLERRECKRHDGPTPFRPSARHFAMAGQTLQWDRGVVKRTMLSFLYLRCNTFLGYSGRGSVWVGSPAAGLPWFALSDRSEAKLMYDQPSKRAQHT
jgi:hypothetical protein